MRDTGCGANVMSVGFYYALDAGKRRVHTDDYLDTDTFDFVQNFASDLDVIIAESHDQSEACLSVIRSSFAGFIHAKPRPATKARGS